MSPVVTVLAWLFLLLVVAVPIGLVLLSLRGSRFERSRLTYQVMVDLHAIRRRFDLAHFKFELRRDGADARRALLADLRKLHEQDDA
jgi:hypothetical protein